MGATQRGFTYRIIRDVFCFGVFAAAACAVEDPVSIQPNGTGSANRGTHPRKNVNPDWQEPIFLSLERKLANTGEELLRDSKTKTGLEIRIWLGFGSRNTVGFICRRGGAVAVAKYLLEDPEIGRFRVTTLGSPQKGWDVFLTSLDVDGLFGLPDRPELNSAQDDADLLVFEIRSNSRYHVVSYVPQSIKEVPETRPLSDLCSEVATHFGLIVC